MPEEFAYNSQLMDEDGLKEWVLRQLGAGMVKVELTKEQLCDVVEEAKRWFAARKGLIKFFTLDVQDGKTEYCLPNDVDKVIDVVPAVPPLDLSLIFSPFILIDDRVPYDVFAAPSSAGLYSSFTQTLQYIEEAKRILGAEHDWRQDHRTLHIFPLPKNATSILVEYKTNTFSINQLNERDHELVKRYALAWAKKTLGLIRSKYDAYPTAQGNVTPDGRILREEAKEELKALNEELFDSAMPIPFLAG